MSDERQQLPEWIPNPSDLRFDGTQKGLGYFGQLPSVDRKTGKPAISTELSVGVNIGGKEMEIPLLVPTLSHSEIQHVLKGGEPTSDIVNKAAAFAIQRIQAGKSPFAGEGEQVPLPQPERSPGIINGAAAPEAFQQ